MNLVYMITSNRRSNMNKITRDMANAFFEGYNFKRGNTKVIFESSERLIYVYDDKVIAKREDRTGKIYLYGGFVSTNLSQSCTLSRESSVAKSRMNGILEYLKEPSIYEEDGKLYWKDGIEFTSGWNQVYRFK